MLDSGVFPNMQKKVNLRGANSIVDIRKAVNDVWDAAITSEHLSKVASRVRRNLIMIRGEAVISRNKNRGISGGISGGIYAPP